jgi:hypothetical protein
MNIKIGVATRDAERSESMGAGGGATVRREGSVIGEIAPTGVRAHEVCDPALPGEARTEDVRTGETRSGVVMGADSQRGWKTRDAYAPWSCDTRLGRDARAGAGTVENEAPLAGSGPRTGDVRRRDEEQRSRLFSPSGASA